MGVMRFRVFPPAGAATGPELERAYLEGIDSRVFPTRLVIHDNVLACHRDGSESARLNVAYPVHDHGRPVLCTASLREREEPYLLSLELTRGRLGQLRDHLSAWELTGMVVPDDVRTAMREAQTAFRRAACAQDIPETISATADAALRLSMVASERMTEAFIRQRLTARRRRSAHLPVLLSCPLGLVRPGGPMEKPFTTTFTATAAAVEWRHIEDTQGEYEWTLLDEQVEFAERNRLVVTAGPLLDFAPGQLPPWLRDWSHDYYNLQCFVSDFVETAISRYAGRIRLWEVAARANTGGGLGLTEEHRLALTARAIEVARQTDDELQLALRVDQPWGDYQALGQHRLSPLQFVDALLRSGVGLSSITLELAVGYRPGGSDYRDRFEVMRLIDMWSSFGLPLTVSLAFPSQGRRDPRADGHLAVADAQWKTAWGEPAQAEWLSDFVPALMSKSAVVGIEWAHFSDGVEHYFPHAGLIAPDGATKPALERLIRLRQSYWQRGRDAG